MEAINNPAHTQLWKEETLLDSSKMFRVNIPKSAMLNHTIMIMTQLKWAWDLILYQSFFQPRVSVISDSLCVRHYSMGMESEECAVCLCGIDDGDQIRELSCHHAFHKVCLDRWLGYGHVTCPLCRNNVKPHHFTADLRRELLTFNFAAVESTDDHATWWLR
ncbi:RING-H2 finger protein ATL40-like [Salvia miltiorrhiza]|uniref:RING-H2 finger protein ATL40-like n=1 Tax=Salvia miltiorrhiza TaxID=226208 RepID=UPI0025ACDFFF|nr:RING-H2 finger protein ATL40-like [Salvia miltiorrhiza]